MTLLDEILPAPPRTVGYPWTGNIGELPDHFSASQSTQARRCLEQYRQTRVLHKRERPAAALIWGSADHAAHELNFAQKITTHEDVPLDMVEDAFVDYFDDRVDTLGDEIEWDGDTPADVKDRGVELVGVYHRHVSPTVQPVAVEREFTLQLPEMPIPVVGRIDLETVTTAIERKTAKRREASPKPDWRFQGQVYQLVEQKPIEWHVSAKTKLPAVYTPADTPGLTLGVTEGLLATTRRMLAMTALLVETIYLTLGPDEPWPDATTHSWACQYCGFFPTCSWQGN